MIVLIIIIFKPQLISKFLLFIVFCDNKFYPLSPNDTPEERILNCHVINSFKRTYSEINNSNKSEPDRRSAFLTPVYYGKFISVITFWISPFKRIFHMSEFGTCP